MPRRPDAAFFVGLAAAGLVLIRLAAVSLSNPLWGVNAIFYLAREPLLVWTVLPLIALLPFLVDRGIARLWAARPRPLPAWLIGSGFGLLMLLFPAVAAPLLGDGVDRLEATLAGWAGLKGQPAPLDLVIHLGAFAIASAVSGGNWDTAWLSWRLLSYLAGGLAAAAAWKIACLSVPDRGGRVFFFFITLCGGTVLFFTGYTEDYVTLAAGFLGLSLLVLLAGQGRAPIWALWPAVVAMVGLHYFSILLLPALIYALHRSGLWHPSRFFIAMAAVVLVGFSTFVLLVVREYYGGVAAIFVPPAQLLGGYHLLGYLNQQFLACPAWPVLLPLAFTGMSHRHAPAAADGEGRGVAFLSSFLGAASVIMLTFFFFLRPVIGPAADWDLFAIPSFAYAPWLALRVLERWGRRPAFVRIGWSLMVLTAAFTGPWLSANQNESSSLQRYHDLLEWEAGHNPWAASYGYLRLGRYLGRRPHDRNNPEIVGSLYRAVAINPDSATLRKQVAEAFTIIGRPEEARREMAAHHRLMGRYYEKKGRAAEAAEQYRIAIDSYGDATPESLEGRRRTGPGK